MHEKSQPFADFLAIQDIFLPSTFDHMHIGDGGTWRHQDGSWKRHDHVGISSTLSLSTCNTWIPEEVDFSLQREDHRPLFAKFTWDHCLPGTSNWKQGRAVKLSADDFDKHKMARLVRESPLSFHLDVHTHAHEPQTVIMECAGRPRKAVKQPRKQTISSDTWTLIGAKRSWRGILSEQQKLQQKTLLASLFSAWRHAKFGCTRTLPENLVFCCSKWIDQLPLLFINFAILAGKSPLLFEGMMQLSLSNWQAPFQNAWTPILRRSLPRFRQWLVAQDPQKLDQRAPYFQQLESGVECSAADLVNGCHNRQMAMTIVQKEFQCAELPSLIELEDALRATQADRPTGLDPLPSRLFSQQVIALSNGSTNPFRQKGGHGCDLQAWNWIRSSGLRIMLLPTLAN